MTAITVISPGTGAAHPALTQQFAALLPWVIHLPAARPCEGWRTATMTAEAAWDPVKREKYRCRNRARWRFFALGKDALVHAPDGTFCWSHLVMDCLYFSPAEAQRTEQALAELTRTVMPEPRRARTRSTRRQEITP